jgi:acyl-[acyl-carrier-protein]-phospholipid O-acyltransferase / long-chain-fatty-acid--[acyl-carrier-protein] ligase
MPFCHPELSCHPERSEGSRAIEGDSSASPQNDKKAQDDIYPWYDTGDIVHIDEEGYLRILGRAKRFAKVGGEMVSLSAVEGYLAKLWPNAAHAVVTLPDEKKGEQLVLVTEQKGADRAAVTAYAREHGIQDISVPRTVRIVEKLPLLGTGKIDYPAVQAEIGKQKTET